MMKKSLSTIWEQIKEMFADLQEAISAPLFDLGEGSISVGTIMYFILAFIALSVMSKQIRRQVVDRLLIRMQIEFGVRESIGKVSRFIIIAIGSFIIIQTAGVDLSALGIIAGALGVGIGFGLQNITNNLISGIIILFEKPIKLGDRIEVSDIQGDVVNISFRATEIRTNDNITIIVPNSEFISSQVINWSHNDRNIRFRIPVGVSYKEDPEKVRRILLAVAKDNPHVLDNMEATVLFHEYGDSSINFHLAVWTATHTDKPNILKSELYYEIFKRFREEGVEIPFPQRDIHVITPPKDKEQL